MPTLEIVLDGEATPDTSLQNREIIQLTAGMSFVRMPRGMASGKSSVFVKIALPDGRVVLAETSMELFQTAASAFAAADARDRAAALNPHHGHDDS